MAKVMLVEDDNNLREIYGARLQAEGHDIVAAKDGEEALALAVKEKPELIISDVMMPRISGFDMLDILRNAPETKNTKVIMMTALSQAEDKARADKLGADRYLVKSQVTLEDVANVVREVLDGTPPGPAEVAPGENEVDTAAAAAAQTPTMPAAEPAPSVEAIANPVIEVQDETDPSEVQAPPAETPQPEETAATAPPAEPVPEATTSTPEAAVPSEVPAPAEPAPAATSDPTPPVEPPSDAVPTLPVVPPGDPAAAAPVPDPAVSTPPVAAPAPEPPTVTAAPADPTSSAPASTDDTTQTSPPATDQAVAATDTPAATPAPVVVPPAPDPTATTASATTTSIPVETPAEAPAEPAASGAPATETTPDSAPEPEAIKVELPSLDETPAAPAASSAPTQEETASTPVPTTPEETNNDSFVGPNLAEALASEEEGPKLDTTKVEESGAVDDMPVPVVSNGTPTNVVVEPVAPAPEPEPEEEPADTGVSTAASANTAAGMRVINPINDPLAQPDINELLAEEERKTAVENPVANTVITPGKTASDTPPATDTPPPAKPDDNSHVNNIAL